MPASGRKVVLTVLLALWSVPPALSQQADNSKAGVIVEQLKIDVSFAPDGTGEEDREASIKIQSDAGLKAFGILNFEYDSAFERLDIRDISVNKSDGTIVRTAESDAQDVAAQQARLAPTYTDARTKQIPVKGLGVGDTLHFQIRKIRTKAVIPNQFWGTYRLNVGGVIRNASLTIRVPIEKHVKVTSNPDQSPKTRQEGPDIIYSWSFSDASTAKASPVRITTFQSWQEIGRWYGALAFPQAAVTPAIQSKASELTQGLNTDLEKERALYQYVATKFRYISVSFGAGRYQPHTAEEVLTNQYGDCKDKHTLLAALLKAAGIDAWPVLIGVEGDLESNFPSLDEVNHLITYIPNKDGSAVWLDSTPEFTRFGMLQLPLRDKKALLIPGNADPAIVNTPEALPYSADETMEVLAKVDTSGTLTGRFDLYIHDDSEPLLKELFHNLTADQRASAVQIAATVLGFTGTVSNVMVDDALEPDVPFHYSYSYESKNYADPGSSRYVKVPLAPVSITQLAQAPEQPILLGSPGKVTRHAKIELPADYTIVVPMGSTYRSDFADYYSTYAVNGRTVDAVRVLIRKKTKIPSDHWKDYAQFVAIVQNEERATIDLLRYVSNPATNPNPLPALQAENAAYRKIQASKDFEARKKLILAFEQSFPKSKYLPELYIDWSRTLVSRSEFTSAVQYAQKAINAITAIRNAAPGLDQEDPDWKDWIKGLESSAQSNLAWAKQMSAWQQNQIRSNVTRRPN